jgi:alkylation response protein AidB-like acyl-CoA dehydrogenase
VEVLGVTTARLDARPGHALAVPTDAGLVIAEPSRLASAPVNGIDPDVGWSVVTGPADVVGAVDGRWPDALAAARRAIASELVGVSTGMLALATAHVTSREQFGRPIGAYQSVRHRMAEAYAHVEGARATVDAAWADGGAASAAAAKAVAGRAHADAARHCLQVCGAMGLSWEFDLHRFVRRGYALDTLIGSFRQLARAHGQDLLAGSALTRVGSPVAVG